MPCTTSNGMDKFRNLAILTSPAKAKEILNTYKIAVLEPGTRVKNIKIDIIQSYQDEVSYNFKALYELALITAGKKQITKNIVAAFSSPRNREYGYSMGNLIFNNPSRTGSIKVPEQYAYIKKYNLVLMEYIPGIQLTKVIIKEKKLEPLHIESLAGWLANLRYIKPDNKIRRSVDFYHLANNIRIIKEKKLPEGALFEKEFGVIRKDIITWSKKYQQTVVHGDFNPANILIDKNSITIIDFENVHYGDGLMDIANLVAYVSMILKNTEVSPIQLKETMEQLMALYEKHTKPLTKEEKQRFGTYKKYFELLFKTHPLVWGP